MITTKNILVGTILASVVFVGYYLYKQSMLLKALCYDVSGIRYAGAGDNRTNLITTLKFTNYSDLAVDLKSYKIDAFLDGQLIGKISSSETHTIPAKGSSLIDFVSTSDTTQAIGNLIQSAVGHLMNQTAGIFALKGTASVQMGIVSVNNYPIEIEYSTRELLDLQYQTTGESCPEIT